VTETQRRLHRKWANVDLEMGGFVVLPSGILKVLLESAVHDLELLGHTGWLEQHTWGEGS